MIILFGGEKGGTGKTTISTAMATAFLELKKDFIVIDADKQQSFTTWAKIRRIEKRSPITVVSRFSEIDSDILLLAKKYENIIVDTGGRDTPELRTALMVADLFYTPLRPSKFDIESFPFLRNAIHANARLNPKLKAKVVFNQLSTHPGVSDGFDYITLLENDLKERPVHNLSIAKNRLSERLVYQRAAMFGASVLEMNDQKAISEMQSFIDEVIADGEK